MGTLKPDALWNRLAEIEDLAQMPSIEGFLKRTEQADNVEVAPAGDCTHWVPIPKGTIASAEELGVLPCGDHSHPYFRIWLNTSREGGSGVLADLVSAFAQRSRQASPPGLEQQIPGPRISSQPLGGFSNSDAVDIWNMSDLNNTLLDCTFHPSGYCMFKTGVAYHGFVLIACQPPHAYIRYTSKGSCA